MNETNRASVPGARRLVIIGGGDFAELCAYYVETVFTGYTLCAFAVEEKYIRETRLRGLPVVPLETLAGRFPPEEFDVFVAVGYTDMNDVRAELFRRCRAMGYHSPNLVHPAATVGPDVRMGEGNLVFETAFVAPMVTMGDGNIVWNAVNLSHEASIGSFNFFSGGVMLAGKSQVGDNCFFGLNCAVRGGRPIADYTLVGAGAYINAATEEYGVYLPARTQKLEGKASKDVKIQKPAEGNPGL